MGLLLMRCRQVSSNQEAFSRFAVSGSAAEQPACIISSLQLILHSFMIVLAFLFSYTVIYFQTLTKINQQARSLLHVYLLLMAVHLSWNLLQSEGLF